MFQASRRVVAKAAEPVFTMADVEAAVRWGYGEGVEAMQLEHRGKPFLIEDEVVSAWRAEGASS